MLAETWSSSINVSQNSLFNRTAALFGDAQGWHFSYMQGDQDTGSTWRIFYRHQGFNTIFDAPVQVSNTQGETSQIGAYKTDGKRFMVYEAKASGGSSEWWFTEQNANNTWTSPVTLTPNDGSADLGRAFDVGADDKIHFESMAEVSGQYNQKYFVKTRNGGLQDNGFIYRSSDYQTAQAILVTGIGNAQRTHLLVNGGYNVGLWRCYYRQWNGSGCPVAQFVKHRFFGA